MRHRFAGGEAERAVLDLAAEQDPEAIDRAGGLGQPLGQRIEPAGMAGGKRIEAGVQAGERLAVRGQDEQGRRKRLELGDRGQPVAERVALGLATGSARRWR